MTIVSSARGPRTFEDSDHILGRDVLAFDHHLSVELPSVQLAGPGFQVGVDLFLERPPGWAGRPQPATDRRSARVTVRKGSVELGSAARRAEGQRLVLALLSSRVKASLTKRTAACAVLEGVGGLVAEGREARVTLAVERAVVLALLKLAAGSKALAFPLTSRPS